MRERRRFVPLMLVLAAFVVSAVASEEVWRRTQRAGGYGMVAGGLIGLVGAVIVPSAPIKPVFIALVAQSVTVMVYSYYLAHARDVT